MEPDSGSTLSGDELSSATGEPIARLHQLRSLKLIGSEGDEWFAREDVERVRLIQFLDRRQIPLEMVARAEQQEELLSSVLEFLFPDGVGPTYSLAQATDIVGLDDELARRLSEAANAGDDPMDEHDLRMLQGAKVALDAGFPEAALVQLARVYADAQTRVAEAEVHLFHFYVHEALKAAGLSGDELRHSRKSMREQLLPVAELLTRYFHRKAMLKAVREDMLAAPNGSFASPGSERAPRAGSIGDRVPRHLELYADHRDYGRRGGCEDRGTLLRAGARGHRALRRPHRRSGRRRIPPRLSGSTRRGRLRPGDRAPHGGGAAVPRGAGSRPLGRRALSRGWLSA